MFAFIAIAWRQGDGRAILHGTVVGPSMSVDGGLAVGGGTRDHSTLLMFGRSLSMAPLAAAAAIPRNRPLADVRIAVMVYVAGTMIYHRQADPNKCDRELTARR